MLEIYKGIKIEDEVIIVEKQNGQHQGYLVGKNNKSQLETAMHWAKYTEYDRDENGNTIPISWMWKDTDSNIYLTEDFSACANKKYWINEYKHTDYEGVVHEYKNGQFILSLSESAMNSSQGGKLSFWNCSIKAPDGNEYLIGINSECLLSLLRNNTFINGVCQSPVWLGRIKSNVGAFTENMDEFLQSKKDAEIRNGKKTSKYDLGAILIPSNEVYCGKFYKYFDIYYKSKKLGRYSNDYSSPFEYIVNLHSTPEPAYLYKAYKKDFNEDSIIYGYEFSKNKRAGVVSCETVDVDIDKLFSNTKAYDDKHIENFNEHSYYGYYLAFDPKSINMTMDQIKDMPTTADILMLKYSLSQDIDLNIFIDYFKTYGIFCVTDKDEDDFFDGGYHAL